MKKFRLYFLFFLGVLFCFNAQAAIADTLYVGIGETYTTIQAAVNDASTGDTIIVRDGVYNESLSLSKQVTVRSENGYNSTAIEAASVNAILITANYVTISGFTVYGAHNNLPGYYGSGIYLEANHCTISNNRAGYGLTHKNDRGIYVEGVENKISDNICNSNSTGIYVWGYYDIATDNNEIINNTCSNNSLSGIYLASSNYNTISNNICSSNGEYGINLQVNNNHNNILNNTCSYNNIGIYLIQSGQFNNIVGNTCNANYNGAKVGCGILLSGSFSPSSVSINTLLDNNCNSNDYVGIYIITNTENNFIFGNNCDSNKYSGIKTLSSDNSIALNNLSNNPPPASDNPKCYIYRFIKHLALAHRILLRLQWFDAQWISWQLLQ